jgi:hypothetical protein
VKDNRALERALQECAAARAETEDGRTAVTELEADVAKLNAQKRVLVLELRQQKKGLMDQVHCVLLYYTITI